jgi:hypothetical protein
LEPDVFPIGLPAAPPAIATDGNHDHAVATRVAAAQTEARRLMAARESLHDVLHRPSVSTIASGGGRFFRLAP